MPVFIFASFAAAQTHRPVPAESPAAAMPVVTDRDQATTQEQLIKLLRLSPTLTTVVEHDPSLLANQEYVSRNNPQLAQFLQSHPEVSRNPDFYLFTRLPNEDGHPDRALEHAVWPELSQPRQERPAFEILLDEVGPFFVMFVIVGALLWLIRQFLENRRWHRIFRLQMDVHGKLIDKFGSSQELLAYMGTEAGRRFLEAAPIPVDFERDQRVPGAVARVLLPLQIGIVLVLLGIGFFLLRHTQREMEIPMLVLGTVVLMPGIGFILSAGITWALAGRLGLMPDAGGAPGRAYPSFEPKERQ
jgi:hypothetical protein